MGDCGVSFGVVGIVVLLAISPFQGDGSSIILEECKADTSASDTSRSRSCALASHIFESDDECSLAGQESTACSASWLQRRRPTTISSSDVRRRKTDSIDGNLHLESTSTQSNVSFAGNCPADTGGSCAMLNCAASRGETVCVHRRCLCKPGYCNIQGRCVPEKMVAGAPSASSAREGPGEEYQPDWLCKADTGRHCWTHNCYPFQGPTTCDERRHCVCQQGFCSIHGVCFKPAGNLEATVYPVNQNRPIFPRQHGNITTALVMSGGGARSQVISLATLRALENLGLMQNVDAISSVSGGTWAAALYVFIPGDPSGFLGNSTKPEELNLDKLAELPPRALATATAETTKIATEMWWKSVSKQNLWIYTMGEALLQPFGLDGKDTYMASDQASAEQIKKTNPRLKNATFLTPAPGRPRVLVMSGSILAPVGYEAEVSTVVSLQMSPDISGSPFWPDRSGVDYKSENWRSNPVLSGRAVGGGFVETFAWGGSSPRNSTLEAPAKETMRAPLEPLSLARAVGISSAGPASALTQIGPHGSLNVAKLTPKGNVWPILSQGIKNIVANGDQGAATYTLGDGGNIDNSGILAMLQRKASRIIWLINTGATIPDTSKVCNVDRLSTDVAASIDSQITDKFGYYKENGLGAFLTHNQVFNATDLPPIMCELARLRDDGKPVITQKTLRIQRNDWWGVQEGSGVQILFVFNERCGEFIDKLPQETKDELARGSWGSFSRFPRYWPVLQNAGEATGLTPSQTNLLAAHADYVVLREKDAFAKILG